MQAVQSSNANKEETNNQVDSKKRNDGAKNSEKFVSENRLHKRRQRARNQERKQNALNELMARISSFEKTLLGKPGIFVGNLDDLYLPIPDCPLDFWGRVPKICNPNEAILNVEIADASKLSRDKMIQRKYMKKLKKKLLRGEINESERKNMWDKYGRAALNDSNGLTLLSSDRGQRKAWQIENFAFLIKNKLTRHASKESLVVADFGCGSGNLCLALASYFGNIRFVLVDKKPYPLKLAKRRAKEAGLKNVAVMQYNFSPSNLEKFEFCQEIDESKDSNDNTMSNVTSFDIGIGLHCCGSFTDMVMELCLSRRADCIVCPCCNGAMTSKTTSGYQYPRSSFLREKMSQDEYLGQLSKSADDLGNYEAKCLIEFDRALWARENGFKQVDLWKLNPTKSTPKHHVLCMRC